MAAGPASYGMTGTMGRMHSDAQFAGSSSVKPYGLLQRSSLRQQDRIASPLLLCSPNISLTRMTRR